ncbi:MAG: cation:proton antiporter [Candidatus Dadabacteria bacterium]|nr:cation:proton antiporter [Candidatus Dadabacteria bacterium]
MIERLTSHEIFVMFLALGVLLGAARLLGEVAQRFHQPAVLGEICAGVILGPTVLGTIAPNLTGFLFPEQGGIKLVLEGLITLAVVLFLLVAGMEVDLSTIWRQGRRAFSLSISGIAIPFAIGFVAAWFVPRLLGREPGADPLIFALFFATALSISALPVVAKTLMDLYLYRSDLGMIIMAAAIFDDLTGWIVFAIILGMMGTSSEHGFGIGHAILLTLVFAVLVLTLVRWLIHWVLPWIQAHATWPGGVLGFALSLALLSAAFTEFIGIHAIFGSFLVGVAIGDSSHLREKTRSTINEFISFIFAPLFFASIGLKVNFTAHFDWLLVIFVLGIACVGKVIGCGLGARWGGMAWREAWAVGFGMNARGSMEIILGLLALQYGVIGERMFVALVVMALVTSIISGPMMQRILNLRKPRRLTDYLTGKAFLNPLIANDRRGAIKELANALGASSNLNAEAVERQAWAEEEIMPTGLSNGIAVPHARIDRLNAPVVGVGLSRTGVDFDAADGEPAHIIFLILTPRDDDGAQQLGILADIAKTFENKETREKVLQVANYIEFLALLKIEMKDSLNIEPGEQIGISKSN